MGLGGFKCVDLSANVFPFLLTNVAYLISASRLTERAQRADVASGASQHGARLCHEGHPHKIHFPNTNRLKLVHEQAPFTSAKRTVFGDV